MDKTADLTVLSGAVQEISREIRLMRLQLDNLHARLAFHDGRFGALEGFLHELVNETARGFGQQQQQLTRVEKRINAVDVGLAALQDQLASSTARILQAMEAERPA